MESKFMADHMPQAEDLGITLGIGILHDFLLHFLWVGLAPVAK